MREVKDIIVNGVSLEFILEEHKKWLFSNEGKHADLRGADLRDANLRDANLRDANLRDANLGGANLRDANLRDANLRGADLRDANLRDANLGGANLRDANLRDANLRDANLGGADLRDANLGGANLRDANLGGANLRDAKETNTCLYNELTAFFALQCPEEGSFIAWKKCKNNKIVKLEIPVESKRSSATSRKCRAGFAKVLEVQNLDGSIDEIGIAYSKEDNSEYIVGEIYYPDSFDEDRWNECSNGVHFFITRQEAVNY